MCICIIYSCVLSTFDFVLYLCFCQVNMYSMQQCAVNLWLYVVCMFCQVNMYSMQQCVVNVWFFVVWVFLSGWYIFYASCVLLAFDCLLYEGICHDYIYSIQLSDVFLWLHFSFVVLSWAYVFYTAVCCQPLTIWPIEILKCTIYNSSSGISLYTYILKVPPHPLEQFGRTIIVKCREYRQLFWFI